MTTDLTAKLDAIDARTQAATEGPWSAERIHHRPAGEVEHWCWDVLDHESESGEPQPFVRCVREDELDAQEAAEFIAHARTTVPAMSAALRAVLDLHAPEACEVAGHDDADCDGDPPCAECGIEHPCPTALVITTCLEGAS